MNRRRPHDVAIVGAGMVGAALALTLARAGCDVVVIEPRPPLPWCETDELDLRVVALAPSSVELFGRIGVWESIRNARACSFRRMHVWNALAPGELTFDAADRGHASLGHIVENRLIQHTLWEAMKSEPRIALRCPAQVDGMELETENRSLLLADGTRLSARLVVGADGADSAMRTLANIGTREREYGQRAIVAHVHTGRPHEYTAWQRFLPGATLAFLPLEDKRPLSNSGIGSTEHPGVRAGVLHRRCSVVWSVPEAEAARLLALDDAAFCRELGAAFDYRLGVVQSTTARAAFPLRMRIAASYPAARFALVGDAAHVVHPLAGQGVNLGLRDVGELAEVLVDARQSGLDLAAPSFLRRYERRRRSDDVLSAHGFDAIQRVFASSSLPLAALRGLGLSVADRLGPIKRLFAAHAAGR